MALLVIGTRVCRGVSLRWPPIDVADDSPWITSELALGATLQSLLEVTTPCPAALAGLPCLAKLRLAEVAAALLIPVGGGEQWPDPRGVRRDERKPDCWARILTSL